VTTSADATREPEVGRPADGDKFTRDTLTAAGHYADLGWRIEVGAGHVAGADGCLCECGDRDCPLPGAHPLSRGWWAGATSDAGGVRERWSGRPGASVLLALDDGIAAVEVPALIGVTVLEHLSRRTEPGPVVDWLRRMWFLVATGPDDESDLAVLTEWRQRGVELWPRGAGEFVPLPPTNRGCRHELVWTTPPHVRHANDRTAAELPDLERIVASIVTAIRDARPDLWYGDAADADPVITPPPKPGIHHAA
jgi:hypothetical protein